MRNICLILLLFMGTSLCQEHNYFPHHVGDMWQYIDDSGVFSSVKFLDDSVDANGYTFIHKFPSNPYEYWNWKFSPKGDSAWNRDYGLNSNFLLYRFPMIVGETWRVSPDYLIARVESLEGSVYQISYYPDSSFFHWYWTEEFAIGIGQTWYGNEVMYRYLIGYVIDGDTVGYIINVDKDDLLQPEKFSLAQNYPNPFNPTTKIDYVIEQSGYVNLRVYNVLGEETATLVSEEKSHGRYTVNFNAAGLPSGVYIYRLQSGEQVLTRKFILLK